MTICGNCGVVSSDSASFCGACGSAIKHNPAQQEVVPVPLQNAMEMELYLGGFTSGNLKPLGRGASNRIGGCGLYATSRRIIIVKSKKGYWELLTPLGGIVPLIVAARAMRADISAKAIAELEEQKDFEVRKEDISGIEVTKIHGFKPGQLRIALNSGENIIFGIAEKKIFENVRDVMSVFYPERLKAEGDKLGFTPTATPGLCPSCGMAVRPIDLSCPKCGRKVLSEQKQESVPASVPEGLPLDTIITCPKCGAKNMRTDNCCRECELDLSEVKNRLINSMR